MPNREYRKNTSEKPGETTYTVITVFRAFGEVPLAPHPAMHAGHLLIALDGIEVNPLKMRQHKTLTNIIIYPLQPSEFTEL